MGQTVLMTRADRGTVIYLTTLSAFQNI